MTEEKLKADKKQEIKEESSGKAEIKEKKEAEIKEEKKEGVKEASPAPAEEKEKKNKKINRMKLEEIEKHLKDLQEKGGGWNSLYAQHLLERKKELDEKKESSG